MTRDPALRSQSRLPPWEPGLSGGAVLVTGPRESLVLGLSRTAAPQPHLHSELTSARTAHTEHLSAPIRRGNIYQSILNPSVIRDTIFTSSLLRKKRQKRQCSQNGMRNRWRVTTHETAARWPTERRRSLLCIKCVFRRISPFNQQVWFLAIGITILNPWAILKKWGIVSIWKNLLLLWVFKALWLFAFF